MRRRLVVLSLAVWSLAACNFDLKSKNDREPVKLRGSFVAGAVSGQTPGGSVKLQGRFVVSEAVGRANGVELRGGFR